MTVRPAANDCDRPRNYDRDVTWSTGEFDRGGYFSRNQTGF
jgi:hypothetical protein